MTGSTGLEAQGVGQGCVQKSRMLLVVMLEIILFVWASKAGTLRGPSRGVTLRGLASSYQLGCGLRVTLRGFFY